MANKRPKKIPALCAWCEKKIIIAGREYDTAEYLKKAGLTKKDIVSHGICKKCKTDLMQSIENPASAAPLWVKDKKKWLKAEQVVQRSYRGQRRPPAYFAVVTEAYKKIGGKIATSARGNPSSRAWEAVIEMFRRFHDFEPGEVSAYEYDQAPRLVACLGELEAVIYRSDKWDGKNRSYIHKFKTSDRPLLATDESGKRLYIIGGSYRVKEDGIIG